MKLFGLFVLSQSLLKLCLSVAQAITTNPRVFQVIIQRQHQNFATELVLLDWHSLSWRRIFDTITKFEKRNSTKFCISRFGYFDAICWPKKKPNLSTIGKWFKLRNTNINKQYRFLVGSQKHGMQSGHHAITFCRILQERWMISIYLAKNQSHLLKKKMDRLNQLIRLLSHLIRESLTKLSLSIIISL